MLYSVIHRPEADISEIREIDEKYDPYHDLIGPHVTLLFPVPDTEISQEALEELVKGIAKSTEPFEVEFHSNTTELSWDQWLFLNPTKGRSEFNSLHTALYKGKLKKFLREDIPYTPHIGIGHFALQGGSYNLKDPSSMQLDKVKYEAALKMVKNADIEVRYTATEIELLGVDDDYKKSWTISKFKLNKNWGEL